MTQHTTREQEIKAQLQELRSELHEIENAKTGEVNRSALGKCFKFLNNYSCPEEDSDYWNVFWRAVEISDEGNLVWLTFQTDKYGTPMMRKQFMNFNNVQNRGGEEISFRDYRLQLAQFKKDVELFLLSGEMIHGED